MHAALYTISNPETLKDILLAALLLITMSIAHDLTKLIRRRLLRIERKLDTNTLETIRAAQHAEKAVEVALNAANGHEKQQGEQ